MRDGRTHVRWRRPGGRVLLHGAPPGGERGGGADATLEALGVSAARTEPVEVEFSRWRSQETRAAGRRPPDQRRVEREPGRDAGGARASARARATAAARSRSSARWQSSAPTRRASTTRSAREREHASTSCVGVGELAPRLRARRVGARRRAEAVDARARARPAGRRGARQGLALGRARGRRRRAAGAAAVIRVLIAGARRAHRLDRRSARGSSSSCAATSSASTSARTGPQHHVAKQGTPTMGGLLILFAATVGFLPVTHFRLQALTVLFATLACGAIGFLDDFIKLTHRRSLGLRGPLEDAAARRRHGRRRDRRAPPAPEHRRLHPGRRRLGAALVRLVRRSSSSSSPARRTGRTSPTASTASLAGTGIIALFTFTAMMVVSYVRSSPIPAHRNLTKLDLAIIGAALIGAAIGFLWYNAFPAEVIMGDTGSMAFGGALATFAIMTKTELLLLLDRRHLRDRGALGDDPGLLVQVLRATRVPDGADPPPLRDEGVVRDEDHGALLDRRRDPLRRRLRALLPLLLRRQRSEQRDSSRRCSRPRAWSRRRTCSCWSGSLALGAHERIVDGWVYVVRPGRRARAAARRSSPDPRLDYLLGELPAVRAVAARARRVSVEALRVVRRRRRADPASVGSARSARRRARPAPPPEIGRTRDRGIARVDLARAVTVHPGGRALSGHVRASPRHGCRDARSCSGSPGPAQAAALALAARGVEVVAADRSPDADAGRLADAGVELRLGTEEESLLEGVELVVKSPGVPAESPLAAAARARGIPVWSEVELGYRLLPAGNPLDRRHRHEREDDDDRAARRDPARGRPPRRGRRQRRPPLTRRRPSVERGDSWSCASSRASSSRTSTRFACDVAVLLNLEPDHLDRHGSFEAYRDAKLRIFERGAREGRAARLRDRRHRVRRRRPAARRAADPRRAQPRERRRRDRRGARRGRAATTRSPRRCARSPASRTGSSSCASCAASATSTTRRRRTPPPRAAASPPTDAPLRLILGGSLKGEDFGPLRARAAGERPLDLPRSARRADELAAALDAAGARTTARATSRPRSRAPPRTRSPATSSCSRRRARASTSSRTSRSAATRSARLVEELA